MDGIWLTLITLVVLFASITVGLAVQPLLAERHRARASTDIIWLVVGMIVTFSALVLGLLISSQKASFDLANHNRSEFAASLTQFDQCLRNFGPEAEVVRQSMIAYTAASIAATWPAEKSPQVTLPAGLMGRIPQLGESAVLGDVLNSAEMALRNLHPTDAVHEKLAAHCLDDFHGVVTQRWAMIAETSGLQGPFYAVLVFWLAVIFGIFGLFAPRNLIVLVAMGLCAVCLAAALFIIKELDSPYSGVIRISSDAMREAMAHMLR